mmetsp:Transcript_36379/g.56853  ORF Transcript_36379/g.56853 Transcript_36379/m.56853 type:complete len:85 (+) Transcript_36379:1093-1347(+)
MQATGPDRRPARGWSVVRTLFVSGAVMILTESIVRTKMLRIGTASTKAHAIRLRHHPDHEYGGAEQLWDSTIRVHFFNLSEQSQ